MNGNSPPPVWSYWHWSDTADQIPCLFKSRIMRGSSHEDAELGCSKIKYLPAAICIFMNSMQKSMRMVASFFCLRTTLFLFFLSLDLCCELNFVHGGDISTTSVSSLSISFFAGSLAFSSVKSCPMVMSYAGPTFMRSEACTLAYAVTLSLL